MDCLAMSALSTALELDPGGKKDKAAKVTERPDPDPRDLRPPSPRLARARKKHSTPFVWTKPAAAIIQSHRRMLERTSTAMH